MGKKKPEKVLLTEEECTNKKFTVLYISSVEELTEEMKISIPEAEIRLLSPVLEQSEYVRVIEEVKSEYILLADGGRMTLGALPAIIQQYCKKKRKEEVGTIASGKRKLWLGTIQNLWSADPEMIASPVLMGTKAAFLKAYGGTELAGDVLGGIAYSLQKIGGLKFLRLEVADAVRTEIKNSRKWTLWMNYSFRLPLCYLLSGKFFSELFGCSGRVQRDMVFRMLLIFFACFTFVFMAYISRDYGVTGDEFVDHRHAGYVLDYFAKGDKAALNQPKTALHLYGNSVQVITAALARWFHVEDFYELRHLVGAGVGASGILIVGLFGLRWGGGLCGLLSMLLMFFTPRFFGHSMNNLKDVPFAVGYVISLFYTVRVLDYFPLFRLRHMIGLVLGIALSLGTRSGGLILYPMVLMYAGLYYISQLSGREFYKFGKYKEDLGKMIQVLLIIVVSSYFLAILLWPFALQKPLSAVVYSLSKFTNFNIGLRTIFDGEQMMSNMLPWKYAPKYLCIGMPIVTLIGFFAYFLYMIVRRKEFSIISFFVLFAAIFPVYWVIYKHSNLYGGIRHLLFVMPPMVLIAGRFWSELIDVTKRYVKAGVVMVFIGLFFLPVFHMLRNHPNEYVYFNEFKGGLKGAYGDYETDYYFNSLKQSASWFRENVLPGLPKDQKTIIVTQAVDPVAYYFRKDTNIKVIYSRYYEKYSKDWDYAIFGNVYISQFQLNNHLFPPAGALYTPEVDGFPMSFVLKRETKQELEGFNQEKKRDYQKALEVFEDYTAQYKKNEEVWSRMGKLYYMTGQYQKAENALNEALKLHPSLNEALYMMTLVNLELRDYTKAFGTVGRMLAENTSSPDAWYLRATIYYNLKEYQKAINDLNRLLSFRPNFDRGLVLAGDIFRDNGDYRQAAQMYERATKYRNSINTQVQIADMLVRMKNYAAAEVILKKAMEVQASYYPIYKVKSRMYLLQGDIKKAGESLKQMEQIRDDAELFVLRAMYAGQMNEKELQKACLEQALALEPGNVEALKLQKAK